MGAGLPAMAVGQPTKMLDLMASSRASPLPQGKGLTAKFAADRDFCGSGLARDGGGSANEDVGSDGLIAGKPAPTRVKRLTAKLAADRDFCGSGLARDGGGSANEDVGSDGLIAGKPAPTGVKRLAAKLAADRDFCGSGLARDGGDEWHAEDSCSHRVMCWLNYRAAQALKRCSSSSPWSTQNSASTARAPARLASAVGNCSCTSLGSNGRVWRCTGP